MEVLYLETVAKLFKLFKNREKIEKSKVNSKCKNGIHDFKYHFEPFADQPFEGEDLCCIEGRHTRKCTRCGGVRKMEIEGEFFDTNYAEDYELFFDSYSPKFKDFILFTKIKFLGEYYNDFLIKKHGDWFLKKVLFSRDNKEIPIDKVFNAKDYSERLILKDKRHKEGFHKKITSLKLMVNRMKETN